MVLQIGLGVLPMLLSLRRERFAPIARAIGVIEQNLYPSATAGLNWQLLLLVLSNAAVAIVLACFAFRNREVPYGAD
jgi:hypothetical protein